MTRLVYHLVSFISICYFQCDYLNKKKLKQQKDLHYHTIITKYETIILLHFVITGEYKEHLILKLSMIQVQ